MFYRVVIPTPLEHPGYQEYYFQAPENNYLNEYRAICPEPTRGPAWDRDQRMLHADWKKGFLAWFKGLADVTPITFKSL